MSHSSTSDDTKYWQLSAVTDALGDLTVTVDGQMSVGRGQDCDLVLGSKQVSRKHAKLIVTDGQLYVEDLGSSNGTFIGDDRVPSDQSVQLQAGNHIRFAAFTFAVDQLIDAQPSAPVTSTDSLHIKPIRTHTSDRVTLQDTQTPVMDSTNASMTQDTASQPARNDVPKSDSSYESSSSTLVQSDALNHANEDANDKASSNAYDDANDRIDHATPKDQPMTNDTNDRTTTTKTQQQADPEVLQAKQAATGQMSATNNLSDDDIGTGSNKAADQTPVEQQNNVPANQSNSSWLVWLIAAVVIIGIAVLLANSLMGA